MTGTSPASEPPSTSAENQENAAQAEQAAATAEGATTPGAGATGIATTPSAAAGPDAPGPAAPGAPPAAVTPVWPSPAVPAGAAPAFAVAGGLLAAGLVPLGSPGLGWPLAGMAVVAATAGGLWSTLATAAVPTAQAPPPAAAPSSARPGPAGTPRARWVESAAWGVAVIALLSVGAVRAADWLFALCVFAAAVAAVPAVTSGRSVRGLLLNALLLPAAAVRATGWAYRSAAAVRQRTVGNLRFGLTLTITAVLLLVFGGLLASADAGFARLLGQALPDVGIDSAIARLFVFGIVTLTVLSGVFMLLAPASVDPQPRPDGRRTVRVVEWATPVGALVALFSLFVGVQLTVLFGGASYVLGPDGPDYAEYARSGFGQLVTVTVLTLVVMGVVGWLAPRKAPLERWLLRGLLGALGLLSLVIVASALFRMHTYQEAYGFTRLRVLVSVVELWLGVVFLLVLAAGIRLRAGWLPRMVVATGVAAVLALAVLNPDRFIAEQNIARWQAAAPGAGTQLDLVYLRGLSADALPVLICLPAEDREFTVWKIESEVMDESGDWRSANLSRALARRLLSGAAPPSCGD